MWEFLRLCKQKSDDGSGHSLESLTPSEIDQSSDSISVASEESGKTSHSNACRSGDLYEGSREQMTVEGEEHRSEVLSKQGGSAEVQDLDDVSIVPETPESIVLETPPEFYSASVLDHRSCRDEDISGLLISPDEIPESLRKATIEMAKKYFLA